MEVGDESQRMAPAQAQRQTEEDEVLVMSHQKELLRRHAEVGEQQEWYC